EEFGGAIDRLPSTLWPLIRGLVLRPAREGIRRWQSLNGQRTVLDEMCQGLTGKGLGPRRLETASGGPRGVRARAMAIHSVPGLGLPLALDRSETIPIQVHAALHRNSVPTRDSDGLLRVLGKRLLMHPIQGAGHKVVDGCLVL